MSTKAFILRDPNEAKPDPIIEICKKEAFDIIDGGEIQNHQSLDDMLTDAPSIIFLPILEQDCIGVKISRDALLNGPSNVIIMYASQLPPREYLCLAFREGVDDFIATEQGSPQNIQIQIHRAEKLLRNRLEKDTGRKLLREIESLQKLCRKLESSNAKWEERLLSLVTTSIRMATGELRITDNMPKLLIVASSSSQADSACELAKQIGFDTKIASSASDAMETLKNYTPRVILTDGTLPDMDASSFAKAARKLMSDKPVVIIAWSSNPDSEEILLKPETGIDDFVIKSSTSQVGPMLAAALLGGLR